MPHNNEGETKPRGWKKILAHEMFEYFFNFAFLAFFLVAFAWYRRLLLASYHIEYFGYWAPLIEAAVLAKVIMIGDILHIGGAFRSKPLAVPTIYRTIVFSLLVVLFSVLEHVAGALFHGKKASEGIAELTTTGWQGLLAWYVLIIVAFLPFFTVKEIERVFGEEKIHGMFFRGHVEGVDSLTEDDSDPEKQLPS
jgi:hypothetical protein